MNRKRKGDKISLTKEEAEDILSAVVLYHMEKPNKFNGKYIYNKLIQVRKDFYKKRKSEIVKMNAFTQLLKMDEGVYQEYTEEELYILNRELQELVKESNKKVVKDYLSGIKLNPANRKVISRFKQELKEKYNEHLDNGYGE